MIRTAALAAVCLGVWCAEPSPASAQRNDGVDDSPSQQRVADEFRSAGSKCGAPACRNSADGVYPPSTGPGYRSRSPSPSAGQRQPGR